MCTSFKISIGVPVYNAEKYIERCARSLFEQTYPNLEYVFVDDCSHDNSIKILEKVILDYPERRNQVIVIKHEKNQGVSVARNTLLNSFTGVFFTFVDADDYIMPNAISLLANKQMMTNSDLVTGSILKDFGDNSKIIVEPGYKTVDEMLLHLVSSSGNHENVGRIYRSSIIRNSNVQYVPGHHMGEDWLFLVKAVKKLNKVAKVDDVVYVYDYSNELSAMHKISQASNMCKWKLEDVIILSEIRQEVIDKGGDYTNGVDSLILPRLEDGLILAAKYRDNMTFSKLADYAKKIELNNQRHYLFNKLSLGKRPSYHLYLIYLWANRIKHYLC